LFVSHNETLEFDVQVFVLSLKDMAVIVKSVNFALDVVVSLKKVVVAETKIVLFLACHEKLVLSLAESLLTLVKLGLKFSVTNVFAFSLTLQIALIGELAVKVSLERLIFNKKSRMLVFNSGEFVMGTTKSLMSSSHLEFLVIRQFRKFVISFLSLVEVIVNALDFGVIVLAFSLLHCNAIPQSVNFVLVFGFLLSQFCELILEVVGILAQAVSLICLGTSFTSQCDALLFSSADLISNCPNFGLQLVVASILLIEQEAKVLDFLAARIDGDNILIVSVIIVVVLHEFLVLNVTILLLNGVKLVSKSDVVLIALLNLKDFCLQLGDEQVFLVTSEVHRIVILERLGGKRCTYLGHFNFIC